MQLVHRLLDYTTPAPADVVRIFTGNPVRKANGAIVMGAGAAMVVRDAYPGIDKAFGSKITPGKNLVFVNFGGQYFGWFKVKNHWQDAAIPELIAASSEELAKLAASRPQMKFLLNYPGIGNGKLAVSDVDHLLTSLPDNVFVYRAP